jgi:hypothetical protein
MARSSKISLTASQAGVHDLSLADQLFAVVTRKTPDAAADLLPENEKMRGAAISAFQKAHSDRLARLTPVTEIEKSSRLLSPVIAVWSRIGSVKYLSAAAAMVIATGAGLLLFNPFGEDSIHIEDESGQSAMLSEVNANDKSVSLNFMRRRKKIGEITVGQGSRLRVVKASNGEAFRSEVAFAGTEAHFKLQYKGKASVIVNNGPFKAKVRMSQDNQHQDVHLKFKEMGSPLPSGEPQFEIEVIKGNVQIAEVDDEDEFEHYKEGEKAIFSLSDQDSESL